MSVMYTDRLNRGEHDHGSSRDGFARTLPA